MVELYSKFNPIRLLGFLQKSDDYQPLQAVEVCKNYNLIKEQAYLLMKVGNED